MGDHAFLGTSTYSQCVVKSVYVSAYYPVIGHFYVVLPALLCAPNFVIVIMLLEGKTDVSMYLVCNCIRKRV